VGVVDLCCGGFGGCFELPEWVWLICVAGMGVVGTVEKKMEKYNYFTIF
jgi:hypothetical protein